MESEVELLCYSLISGRQAVRLQRAHLLEPCSNALMLLLRIDFLTGEDQDGLYPSKTLPAIASFAPKSPDNSENLAARGRLSPEIFSPPLFRSLVLFCFLILFWDNPIGSEQLFLKKLFAFRCSP